MLIDTLGDGDRFHSTIILLIPPGMLKDLSKLVLKKVRNVGMAKNWLRDHHLLCIDLAHFNKMYNLFRGWFLRNPQRVEECRG